MRELAATIGDRDLTVIVQDESGHWRVEVDGRVHEIDAVEVRPGTWSLILDGHSYLVDLDRRGPATAVLARGAETVVVVEDAHKKRMAAALTRSGGSAKGEVIKAPISGKVVKLLVIDGDQVEAGQGVIVLEAMKMENEIKAERGGLVTAVHVEPGQAVETFEQLVTLA
jgi:biotin carboxyl carrier protein